MSEHGEGCRCSPALVRPLKAGERLVVHVGRDVDEPEARAMVAAIAEWEAGPPQALVLGAGIGAYVVSPGQVAARAPVERTKVYVAGPYGAREQLRQVRERLRAHGHVVSSSWMDEDHEVTAGTQGAAVDLPTATVAGYAATDLLEVGDADVLVLFTAASVGVEGGGGRHVETGYALAKGVQVVVVGEPENVFHRLPLVASVGGVGELVAWIDGYTDPADEGL